jgi:threonine dehydrogenase-like Zn-dependent dehydrogenase
MARLAGARHVVVTDVDARRLEVARQLGADIALSASAEDTTDRIFAATDGGPELIIDAAGFTSARQQAIAIAPPGAMVVLLGTGEPNSELPIIDVVNREIILHGSYSCTDEEFRRSIRILADGKISAGSWIETSSLEEGPGRFAQLASRSATAVRVMFDLS